MKHDKTGFQKFTKGESGTLQPGQSFEVELCCSLKHRFNTTFEHQPIMVLVTKCGNQFVFEISSVN